MKIPLGTTIKKVYIIGTGLTNWELLNVAQLMGFISLVSNNGW